MAVAAVECFSFRLHQSTTGSSMDKTFHQAYARFILFLTSLKSNQEMNLAIQRYGINFISFYTKAMAHRLLRTPLNKREEKTVAMLMEEFKQYANELIPQNNFNPYANNSVKLARTIDSNFLTRSLFLLFKKIHPGPIYK